MSQDQFFVAGEGDRYYRRNREALRAKRAEDDPPLALIREYDLRPASVLELGCADGWRLELLRARLGCRATGVDPSREAIEAGRADFPALELVEGTLASSPLGDRRFDLVIVYFVLHWNARETLLGACAGIDRHVADGGHLIVGDFLPDRPERRPYHHAGENEEAFTFKQDYAQVFTASNLYNEVARLTFDHGGRHRRSSDVPADERGMCSLLRKSLAGRYPIAPAPGPAKG